MIQIRATFAKTLLFAITLFFLGPQLGSLDFDGDDLPDMPVIVMHDSNYQRVQPKQSDGKALVLATASPFSGLICDGFEFTNGRISVDLGRAALDSVTPLRC